MFARCISPDFCLLTSAFIALCFNAVAAPAPRALPAIAENKIRALLKAPDVQSGHIGVLISALGTANTPQDFPSMPYDDKAQPVLFAQDADKRFLPASNMKLFTSAMALKVLGPDKTFPTTVFYSPALGSGVAGLLRLQGGGDPSFNANGLQKLAQNIYGAGVKSYAVVGVGNPLYKAEEFANRYPNGWTLDDTTWYYGPIVSALAYERNHIDVTITGGQKTGDAATISIPEGAPRFVAAGDLKTGGAQLAGREGDDLLSVQSLEVPQVDGITLSRITSIINGALAPKQKVTFGLAVPSVDNWTLSALEAALKRNGLKSLNNPTLKFGPAREIARHESPPLKELFKRLLKNSDNLYAEMILRNAAVYSLPENQRKPNANYARRGHQLISDWLKENKVSTEGLSFSDGSGLSRYNMVTPRAINGLLSAAEKLPGADAFWNALPIAGVDGTMRNRSKGTLAENNARAKSGTFSIVSCLSGYVTTKDKQRLSVVILTNFVPSGSAARRLQDDIFTALAAAEWKAN